jgi:hypothetical protein
MAMRRHNWRIAKTQLTVTSFLLLLFLLFSFFLQKKELKDVSGNDVFPTSVRTKFLKKMKDGTLSSGFV